MTEREFERRKNFLIVAFVGAVLFGLALIVAGFNQGDDLPLWGEIGKAGLQIIGVGVIGGALTWAVHLATTAREQHNRDAEQRLALFRELVCAYNRAKAIRRTLRSLGLPTSGTVMDETQAVGFREQMTALSLVELDLEAQRREIGESALFEPAKAKQLITELATMEDYLSDVIRVWERRGATVTTQPLGSAHKDRAFVDFVGNTRGSDFERRLVEPRQKITKILHAALFGEPDKEQGQAAARIDRRRSNGGHRQEPERVSV